MPVGSRGDDAVRLVETKNGVGSKICGPEAIGASVVGISVVAAVAVDVNAGVRVITEYTRRRDMQAFRGDGIGLNGERNRGRWKSRAANAPTGTYFYTLPGCSYLPTSGPARVRCRLCSSGDRKEPSLQACLQVPCQRAQDPRSRRLGRVPEIPLIFPHTRSSFTPLISSAEPQLPPSP